MTNLIDTKNALAVSFQLPDEVPNNAAALWIGSEFTGRVESLGMKLPPLPSHLSDAEGGKFAIGTPEEMFVYLDRWVQAAFDRFRSSEGSRERSILAELMQWTLPADPRTLAAAWQTAANAAAEIDMQLRVFAKSQSAWRWRRSLQATLDKRAASPRRVVVFTGSTGSDRASVFNEFVRLSKRANRRVVARSFREVVVEHALTVKPEKISDKAFLMDVGQRMVERSPLFMAAKNIDAMLANGDASDWVMDSVRHRSVLEAIEWILPTKITAVGVRAAPDDVRQRLTAEHYNEREIQQDPTEIDIPGLIERASFQIDTTTGQDWKRSVEVLSQRVLA